MLDTRTDEELVNSINNKENEKYEYKGERMICMNLL